MRGAGDALLSNIHSLSSVIETSSTIMLQRAASVINSSRNRASHQFLTVPRRYASAAGPPGIVYPGSGIFFWWQAGATKALAQRFHMRKAQFAGVSGGSLAATLAACDCDSDHAFEVAWRMCIESGAFDRGAWGLFGIWGGIVRAWLAEILPADAHERCRGRVNILVSQPMRSARCVSDFHSRQDLIDACLASAHIPLFMDGALTAPFRGGRYIDHDILGRGKSQHALVLPVSTDEAVRISVGHDARVRELSSSPGGTVKLLSQQMIREVMEWGAESVRARDAEGSLKALESLRIVRAE